MYENVFSNIVVDNWNSLPGYCLNCCTTNIFKKLVSIELESVTVKLKYFLRQ